MAKNTDKEKDLCEIFRIPAKLDFMEICPACEGYGIGLLSLDEIRCPKCHGTGALKRRKCDDT